MKTIEVLTISILIIVAGCSVNSSTEKYSGETVKEAQANGEAFSVSLDTDLMVAGVAIQSEKFPEKKEECVERICDY
ncbi:hypothetical protein [Guptibacillus hwajinpoensis]|uniref:Lipoprotein n=1 Tax=Guptibacillus hwajinpoensis TaxID=208199 RepID=A0A0J6D1I3_9BACL|nr:hypothetical protein [Alkalihalobacillus macyae]KMM39225.1 hypothetical protein AB986_08365 [Alkalihalobacillus macyae]